MSIVPKGTRIFMYRFAIINPGHYFCREHNRMIYYDDGDIIFRQVIYNDRSGSQPPE
jgi:hypothetical protein